MVMSEDLYVSQPSVFFAVCLLVDSPDMLKLLNTTLDEFAAKT